MNYLKKKNSPIFTFFLFEIRGKNDNWFFTEYNACRMPLIVYSTKIKNKRSSKKPCQTVTGEKLRNSFERRRSALTSYECVLSGQISYGHFRLRFGNFTVFRTYRHTFDSCTLFRYLRSIGLVRCRCVSSPRRSSPIRR